MKKQTHKIFKYLMLIFVFCSLALSLFSEYSGAMERNFIFMIGTTLIFTAIIWADIFFTLKKKAFWFILLAAVISFISEYLGVNYGRGAFGGSYYYNSAMGVFLGGVPLVVIFMWTAIVYICYRMAVFIAGKKIRFRNLYERIFEFFAIALLSGLAAVSWDLAWDPLAVKMGSWTWRINSPYFGIPLSNFAGWVLVVFLSVLFFEALTKNEKDESRDIGIPLMGYFYLMVSTSILALKINEPHFSLLSFIFMAPYLLIILVLKMKRKDIQIGY